MSKKRKVKLTKKGKAVFVAVGVTLGGFGIAKGRDFINGSKSDKNSIYNNQSLIETTEVFDYSFDNFNVGEYHFNEDVTLFVKNQESGNMDPVTTLQGNNNYYVYDGNVVRDNLNNNYFYCEDSNNKIIALVDVNDLNNARKIRNVKAGFSSIFEINSKDGMTLSTLGNNSSPSLRNLKDGEIIFANQLDLKYDDKKNLWMKVRTSNGDIGYVQATNKLKEIKDVALVQIVNNSNEIIASGSANLSQDVENVITNIDAGDRLVVVGNGKNKNSSRAIYFDEYGIARVGEISNELLEEVELENFQKFDIAKNNINDVITMNQHISDWSSNILSGVKGIDIWTIDPNNLKHLLISDPEISYGVVKIGSTGYGITNPNLCFASDITTDVDEYNRVKSQIDVLKNANKDVFGYYYTTEINIEESNMIVDKIEQSIDVLGGGITPILDFEYASDEKQYDRNYWGQKPNYDKYINQGGIPVDFEYIEKLDSGELLSYIENNPEVQKYIEFCQTEKAKCIANMYKRLYEDGYIKSKNALLYTGNGHFSKDTYKVCLKTNTYDNHEVVLAKFDEVKDFLINPQSEYFISEDFNLKVWYADYTGKRNDKMFGNDCAMVQTYGDKDYYGDVYDENYACVEFLDSMNNKINTKDKQIEDDELELN